jgi:hypothetical protein
MDFKRSLSYQEHESWLHLQDMLQAVTIVPEHNDTVSWALERKGQFTTKSLYRFLTDRGVASRSAKFIWNCKVPLKIKFFLWQSFNNKLQVAKSLVKRGWKIEGINHLFFGCYLARMVWGVIKEIFHLDWCPSSLNDFSCIWLQGKGPLPSRLLMFLFAGFAWSLWTTRNKLAIEKSFPKAPTDVLYAAISFMQKWSLLLKETDKERIDHIIGSILTWLKAFRPNAILQSDVSEI